jgi:isoleucyl-tRNA synthetase
MSKSRGNALSPQEVLKQHGADVIRLWVSMIDYQTDMAIGPQIMGRAAEAYKKIRNTARYLLSNLNGFEPERDAVPHDQLFDVDKWVLARAAEVFDRCLKAYGEYEFHIVYHRILDLCTVALSSLYLDISKDTLYCDGPESASRRSAQTAMYEILRGMVAFLAPILTFTCEEIYEAMPGTKEESVHLIDFPAITAPASDTAAWDRIFRVREAVSKVLEGARAAGTIGQSLEADVTLHGVTREAIVGGLNIDLAKVFIVSHVDFTSAAAVSTIDIEGVGPIGISMSPARGKKCGRCWQYREEVLEDGGLCARCDEVVATLEVPEQPTV